VTVILRHQPPPPPTTPAPSQHPEPALDSGTWQERGLCAQTDPEAFFPEKGGTTRPAKTICARCEVRAECLAYALDHDERFGIWGGLSERERRRLKHSAAHTGADQHPSPATERTPR
jgi:WhiB family redox-sensing transcriptional regulator